jgi:two-component system sensor histidine kinase and response regulator WspE
VDFTNLRSKLVQKKLTTLEIVEELSESELLEFLFLPGFSTTEQVTELSGRGVGLDIVYNMVREVAGQIRCTSQPGNGMTVHLQLPVTLSLLRTLLVEIGGETYGFPLVRIDKTLLLGGDQIKLEGNSQIEWNGTRLFLASARSILDLPVSPNGEDAPVIVVSDRDKHYAIIVDGFLMQKDLVVRPLDARLGKVKNVYAASVLEDGSPVLILDVQDMLHSIDQRHADSFRDKEDPARAKRVLVVEDSMTVRDFAGQLLKRQGFDVDLAVDGMDGWNALKTKSYDMVITDLDMPRMNGTELVQRMRADSKLNGIPVVMVSYKERTEDRDKALQAGANRFLSKTSFHDESFLRAVRDLLGESES